MNDYEELQKENSGILKAPKIIRILGMVEMVIFGICTAGVLFSKKYRYLRKNILLHYFWFLYLPWTVFGFVSVKLSGNLSKRRNYLS